MSRIYGDWEGPSSVNKHTSYTGTGISIELTNRDEIVKLLDQIPKAFNSKAVRELIKRSVKPMIEEAKKKAPIAFMPHKGKYGYVQPETLVNSIWTIDMKRSKFVTVVVGPRTKGRFGGVRSGFYGMFLEFGTKNIKARPFMRPAWDAKKSEVIRLFEKDAAKIFQKTIQKLTKKGLI